MSQQALYETDKYITHKGKKIKIKFHEEYFDMVPRPVPEERQQLKEDIQLEGLLEDIKINLDGLVLDGHTRIEICEEIGWRTNDDKPIIPKFTIKEFETKDEERDYVLKTNLVRRQLNSYQKVRLVFKLYQKNKYHPNNKRQQNMYDVLTELKKCKNPVRARIIGDKFGWDKATINRFLRELKEEFCVGNNECKEKYKNARGATIYYTWYILPKGEEFLYKGRPKNYSLKTLARSIGLERNLVGKAIWLMEHANEYTLASLEQGKMSIMKAYVEMTKAERPPKVANYNYLKNTTKVVCPHCNQVSMKKEWKLANGTV